MRPKYDRDDLGRKGITVMDLLEEHKEALLPRLGESFISEFSAGMSALSGKQFLAADTKAVKMSWTKEQNQALKDGSKLVAGVRTAISKNFPKNDTLLARFKVGESFAPNVVSAVLGAIDSTLEAAKENPAAVSEAGILTEDLAELGALRSRLDGANKTQESKKGSSTQATADRDAAQLQVEQQLDRLWAAAVLAFRKQPEVLAAFERAMPTSRSTKKKRSPASTSPETPVEPE
jgi:hypothetical protein